MCERFWTLPAPAIVRAIFGAEVAAGNGTRLSEATMKTVVSSKRPSAVRQGTGAASGLRGLLRVEAEVSLTDGGFFAWRAVNYLVSSGKQRHRKLMWIGGNHAI